MGKAEIWNFLFYYCIFHLINIFIKRMRTGNSNCFKHLRYAFHSLYQQGFTKQTSFRKLYILVEWGGLHFVWMLIILMYVTQGCAPCSTACWWNSLSKYSLRFLFNLIQVFSLQNVMSTCYIKSSPCNTIKSLRHINRFNLINESKHNAYHIIIYR